jgi:hypothetical protein
VILIRKSAMHKFEQLTTINGVNNNEFEQLYGTDGMLTVAAKTVAWLSLHVQGRLLPSLIPKALEGDGDRVGDEYMLCLGELCAASCLGCCTVCITQCWGVQCYMYVL